MYCILYIGQISGANHQLANWPWPWGCPCAFGQTAEVPQSIARLVRRLQWLSCKWWPSRWACWNTQRRQIWWKSQWSDMTRYSIPGQRACTQYSHLKWATMLSASNIRAIVRTFCILHLLKDHQCFLHETGSLGSSSRHVHFFWVCWNTGIMDLKKYKDACR